MNNKKRAFMVPVMTLAVCAIAMIGLGFALTTSVTSDNNTVERLMVDISSTNDSNWTGPTTGNIDNLLSFGIQSVKEKDDISSSYTVSKTLVSKQAYLKIFGNVSGVTLTVEVGGMTSTGISSMELEICEVNTSNTQTIEISENSGVYKGTANNLSAGKVYTVEVSKVNNINIGEVQSQTDTSAIENSQDVKLDFTFTAVGGTVGTS